MKQNTMFPNLIQKFITAEDVALLTELIGYEDTARKLTVGKLIEYLVTAAASEWKGYRHCGDVGTSAGLVDIDHSTLSKKMKNLDYGLMKKAFALVVDKCNRATRRALKIPKRLLLVDSTTLTVGKNRLPWALYHGERSGIKLHVSYTPETCMPLDVVETTGLVHDGPVGEGLADQRFILVQDRAYFNIKRIDQFVADKQDFVIRMKENIELSTVRSLQRLPEDGTNITRDFTCRIGTPQSRSKKRHRVVFFTDHEGQEIRVVTSLRHVSAEAIAAMYKARWGIESFFRWIKQNLNVPKLFGQTPNAVYNQLFAALIAYVLVQWLYQKTKPAIRKPSLSLVAFQRTLLSGTLPLIWLDALTTFLYEHFARSRSGL
ncbi:IS4 family transposase [Planococcus sp. SE5232]|uniref:IS4 family transposase n=1 Tax=unclassified Planococcus (in: firmicutes) TaxID=2662419 RepID=UPI003D6AE994